MERYDQELTAAVKGWEDGDITQEEYVVRLLELGMYLVLVTITSERVCLACEATGTWRGCERHDPRNESLAQGIMQMLPASGWKSP
jgi:hypothetical protein